jgi:hypothetical protein
MSDGLFQRMLDEISFYGIAKQEAKRTILCEPDLEHAIRAAVDQLKASDILTVCPSPACPEGQLIVIDEGALEAQHQEWLQSLGRRP